MTEARGKAVEILKQVIAFMRQDYSGPLDPRNIEAIQQALLTAEKRGLERAAEIAEKADPYDVDYSPWAMATKISELIRAEISKMGGK